MMDRPLGPRQPDKRLTAYESIFGRPGASHQLSEQRPLSNQSYPPPANYSPSQYPYPSAQPQYSTAALDRHNSFSPHPYLAQQPPPPNSRQSFYAPSPPQNQSWNYSAYPYHHPQYPHPQSSHASVTSSPLSPGVVVPPPDDPPDPSLEALTRQGLTPAQAYQAQVYHNNVMTPPQGPWGPRPQSSHQPPPPQQQQQPQHQQQQQQRLSAYDYDPDPRYQNGAASRSHTNIPRLGVNIDVDNGRLGLDFGEESSTSDTDESELPWARSKSSSSRQPHQSHYQTPQPIPAHHRLSQRYSPPDALSIRSADSSHSAASSVPPPRPYPLQLDTALMNQAARASPASSTYVDSSAASNGTRRSSESSRTMPAPFRRDRSTQDRTRSMSAATTAHVRAALQHDQTIPSPASTSSRVRASLPLPQGNGSAMVPSSPGSFPRRSPIVYPALLSRVAEALRARIALSDVVKDGLTYTDAFDGRQAVDKIAYIIKTTDRNLALLLGRALDAQKYFHAVTYDHRLRDSPADVYQFRTRVPSPFVSGELSPPGGASPGDSSTPGTARPDSDRGSPSNEASTESEHGGGKVAPGDGGAAGLAAADTLEDVPLPTGVFTLLTDCYSPTCSRDQLCYSITCPRRLEQQSRLNMKPQPGLGIRRQLSRESLGELEGPVEPGLLWVHTVSKEIVDSVSDQEKKRQEAINEVIYTERDFVRDMEYLRDVWIAPLRTLDIIPEPRRAEFIQLVFWNVTEIIAVNTRLRDALNKRQKSYAVIEGIADIFLDTVRHFGPFVSYGAHQLYGKFEFEKEKSSNPAFAQFVEETERRPESRKLELNAYLTKPTTRLARYPLLLEAVLKHTPEDSQDKQDIPKVVTLVREFLAEVNLQTGRAENRFNLLQLDQQLVFRPGEQVDLRLREDGRELIYKGPLRRRGGSQGDSGELLVFLLDHALLMVKQKNKADQYKVYRPPIPLELLLVIATDESGMRTLPTTRAARRASHPHPPVLPVKLEGGGGGSGIGGKSGFAVTFVHLGRKFYQMTLWAATQASHRKWLESIARQQELMRARSTFFDAATLSEGFFLSANRVNCAAPFAGGAKVAYGTFDGVYFQDLRGPAHGPIKVLALTDVAQVDVLDDYGLLVVLSEGQVITFPLDALEAIDPLAGLKRAKRIAAHTSFFKSGACLGRTFVCVVKTSPLSSTIKIFEPIDQTVRGRSKPTFRKLLQGGNDTLRIYKEFYIPVQSSSIHFLRTKLCVACVNGFEIIDPDTLDTQGLLDPSDESLEFVRRRGDSARPKPVAIYRIENEFLLCYDEFAFYINRGGRRSRKNFMVYWEGTPTSFAFQYPYVLAFEPTFVEIRNVETGAMSQVLQGNNLRCLFADTPPAATHAHAHPRTSQGSFSSFQGGSSSGGGGGGGGAQYGRASLPAHAVYGAPVYGVRGGAGAGMGGAPPAREEIIFVSDDRVMTLRMALPGQ